MPVGLVIKPRIKEAIPIALEIVEWLQAAKLEICLDRETDRLVGRKIKLNGYKVVELAELPESADPIITLGGDGTLIGVARHVEGKSPVMIGVNFGNLGFLTEIPPSEAISALTRVLAGEAAFAERAMLRAEVRREGKIIFSSQAVNDAVVQKGAVDPLLDLDIAVDSHDVMRLRADGIIAATPTGSTAYSLSAGGSIVYPSLEVMLLTPICPHSLTNRPLVLGLDSLVQIKIPAYTGKVFLIVDGQKSTQMYSGDELLISRGRNKVRFVRSETKNYFQILSTKLNWGIPNRSG